jgi:hypothetical protein
MFQECRHIKSNGSKCRAAALKGKAYCYYHFRLHTIVSRAAAPTAPYEQRELEMPFLEDRGAVQIALSEVVSAIAARRIDHKSAALLVYALQVASSNAKNAGDIVADQQVREQFETEEGEQLAPEVTTLEPNDEGYLNEYGEPSLADLLLAEVRRRPDEVPDDDTKPPERIWSGDPWAGRR